jgi:hexosaminidase
MTPVKQFPVRGYCVDLRVQVLTLPALKTLARDLAAWGMNTLLIEYEGTYPYLHHGTLSNRYAYKRRELGELMALCDELGLDVIPLQQSFGHVEYILRHERYAHLREEDSDVSQLCPLKSRAARSLLTDLLTDMASLHSSKYIHLGGDETYLLGHCPGCAEYARLHGKSRLYVDHMSMVCDIVTGLGRRPVLFADMVLKHPEAVAELPPETILQDWNYGSGPSSASDVSALQETGLEIWGMPSIRSAPDCYHGTRWEAHLRNLRDYIPRSRSAGYRGMILSSWAYTGECGYEWEARAKLLELHGFDRRYPTSGFRLALDAFACALGSATAIRPADVACGYAQDRFGLTLTEARKIWRVLQLDATPVEVLGKRKHNDPSVVLRKALGAKRTLAAIQPRRYADEFEHLRLMMDFTIQRLRLMVIERKVHSTDFTSSRRARAARKLARLFSAAEDLDLRFIELNTGYLHPSELAEENRRRNRAMHLLYDRLAGRR